MTARNYLILLVLACSTAAAEPRTHDGLYVRIGVGPGLTLATLVGSAPTSTSTGVGVSTQLAIGWTIRRGLVVGLGTFPAVTPAPSYDGIDAGGQHVSATGPFVDYYPDPKRGLHVQAGLLFALGYLDGGDRPADVGAGIGATVGAGYEVFVSDEWSLGAIARVTAYQLYGVDDSIRLLAPAVLIAVTRH